MVTELNENLMGFKRKLMEIVNDDQINQILNLFPPGIIMPLFYIGDDIRLKDGRNVIITNVSYKNGEYIYYYNLDGDLVYSYESEFVFEENFSK
jgi:hypothetical protein